MFAEQFARGGALSGDDLRVGERMDHRRTGFVRDARGHLVAIGKCRAAQIQRRAECLDAGDLRGVRTFRHHDVRRNGARFRGQRDGGTMISRRVRDDAALGDVIRQRPHGIARAAELERADVLEILALEYDAASGEVVDGMR